MTAEELIARTDIVWHQRFELAPGVYTPGINDIATLSAAANLPSDLTGLTVLDIGTTNGGAAFEAERRGAARIVAVDIQHPEWFGFAAIREFLGSRVEYVRASVYELANLFDKPFDIVLFWGVLYHLRHPLLALDSVRALTGQRVYVETAIADASMPQATQQPLCQFFRKDELARDGSNWFRPTSGLLFEWLRSCGLEPEAMQAWPAGCAERCMVRATPIPGPPEFISVSYEQPVRCFVLHDYKNPTRTADR